MLYLLAIPVSLVLACGLLHGLCGWCMVYMDPSFLGLMMEEGPRVSENGHVLSTVVGVDCKSAS